MALKSSYDALSLRGYKLDEIRACIDIAKTMNQTVMVSKDVHFITDTATGVPPFPAPIVHEGVAYLDAREFTSTDRNGKLKVRNPIEYQLRYEQACLELIWANTLVPHERLMTQMSYHIEVFSKWLAGGLTRTYGLNPTQEMQIMAACSLYAVGQYYNHVEDEITTFRLQEVVAKRLNINIQMYEAITGETEYLFPRSVEEFVNLLKVSDISPRLRDVSSLAIIQALGGSFWGVTQEKVLVSLALEYPPALYTMMATCIANTSFKKTRIGSVIAYAKAGRSHEQFLLGYQQLIARNTAPKEKRD